MLKLYLEGECVYEGNIHFTFSGEDVNKKTTLGLYYSKFANDDGSVSVVLTAQAPSFGFSVLPGVYVLCRSADSALRRQLYAGLWACRLV